MNAIELGGTDAQQNCFFVGEMRESVPGRQYLKSASIELREEVGMGQVKASVRVAMGPVAALGRQFS